MQLLRHLLRVPLPIPNQRQICFRGNSIDTRAQVKVEPFQDQWAELSARASEDGSIILIRKQVHTRRDRDKVAMLPMRYIAMRWFVSCVAAREIPGYRTARAKSCRRVLGNQVSIPSLYCSQREAGSMNTIPTCKNQGSKGLTLLCKAGAPLLGRALPTSSTELTAARKERPESSK